MIMKEKLLYVKFADHYTHKDAEINDLLNITPVIIETVGWYVDENDEYLIIANTRNNINEQDVWGILKAVIIERRTIKY